MKARRHTDGRTLRTVLLAFVVAFLAALAVDAHADDIDATLIVGERESRRWGTDYAGAIDTGDTASFAFNMPQLGDLRLVFVGYDIEPGELRVEINGQTLVVPPQSANNGGRSYIYTIPVTLLRRENVLSFVRQDATDGRWGVATPGVEYMSLPDCRLRPAGGVVVREVPPNEWVMVGSGGYYCPLDVLDLPLAIEERGVTWALFAYRDGEYVAADVLEPGEGAWLKHTEDGPIRFAP